MPLPLSLTVASTGQPSLSWKASGQLVGAQAWIPVPVHTLCHGWAGTAPALEPGEGPSRRAWHPL